MLNRYLDVKAFNEKGYNCAQAVACAYADLTNVSHEDIFKLTECLGGGIGSMQGICGALTGAFLIASYRNSDGKLQDCKTKKETYAEIQKMQKEFVEKLGSDNCLVLLKGERPKAGLCFDKLETACKILETYLKNKQN